MKGTDSETGAASGVNGDESPRERLAVAAVLVLACAWRLADSVIHLTAPDEGFTYDLASGSWDYLLTKTIDDVHPPLYYALVKVWFWLTGPLVENARALSALFSVGAIVGVRLLARELFGRHAAWLAFLAAAFAPYTVFWGHAARNHQLLPLFAVFAVLWGYRHLREPSRRSWWWCAVCLGLGMQTNYMGLVFCALWCGAMVLEWKAPLLERVRLCAAVAPGAIAFSPWVPIMFQHTGHREMNVGFFQEEVSPIYFYFHGLFGEMTAFQPPQHGMLYLAKLLFFAVVAALGLRVLRGKPGIAFLLLASPTVPILMVKIGHMTLAERHLVFALPVFYAWWGAAMVETWRYFSARFGGSAKAVPNGG